MHLQPSSVGRFICTSNPPVGEGLYAPPTLQWGKVYMHLKHSSGGRFICTSNPPVGGGGIFEGRHIQNGCTKGIGRDSQILKGPGTHIGRRGTQK